MKFVKMLWDALLSVCRADIMSVQIVKNKLKRLSDTSSLILNVSKCVVYYAKVREEEWDYLCAALWMVKGDIPFKYL